jgi:2,4-dienoyl-CoA reductase-like NADH-dependent reductase (Old Yellow Enzyme family)
MLTVSSSSCPKHQLWLTKNHHLGGVAAIQLAHGGRKASTLSLWDISPELTSWTIPKEKGGWPDQVVGPSPIPFDSFHNEPKVRATCHFNNLCIFT